MCTAFTGHCSYILSCLRWSFESLWRSPLSVDFLEWIILYLNEQTFIRQLTETLDIWDVFSRIFTFNKWFDAWENSLNSHWWVGDLILFEALGRWGIWPSNLPTYISWGIWLKFFKKVKCPCFQCYQEIKMWFLWLTYYPLAFLFLFLCMSTWLQVV